MAIAKRIFGQLSRYQDFLHELRVRDDDNWPVEEPENEQGRISRAVLDPQLMDSNSLLFSPLTDFTDVSFEEAGPLRARKMPVSLVLLMEIKDKDQKSEKWNKQHQ